MNVGALLLLPRCCCAVACTGRLTDAEKKWQDNPPLSYTQTHCNPTIPNFYTCSEFLWSIPISVLQIYDLWCRLKIGSNIKEFLPDWIIGTQLLVIFANSRDEGPALRLPMLLIDLVIGVNCSPPLQVIDTYSQTAPFLQILFSLPNLWTSILQRQTPFPEPTSSAKSPSGCFFAPLPPKWFLTIGSTISWSNLSHKSLVAGILMRKYVSRASCADIPSYLGGISRMI